MSKVFDNMIVIEGMDCTGKSTACKDLKDSLDNVIVIKFPDYNNPASSNLITSYLSGDLTINTKDEFIKTKTISTIFLLDRYNSLNVKMHRSSNPDIDKILNNATRDMSLIEIMEENQDKLFVFDRYIQSNIIHQTLTLPDDDVFEYGSWLIDVELNNNALPTPKSSFYLIPSDFDIINQRIIDRVGKDVDILEREYNLHKTFINMNRESVQEVLMNKFPSINHRISIGKETTSQTVVEKILSKL